MTPESQRIHDLARMDIIEGMIEVTGAARQRLRATDEDMMMFCVYGLAAFVEVAKEKEQMMLTIIDLLSHAVGAEMETGTIEREADA